MNTHSSAPRKMKHSRLGLWHIFVLLVGYSTLLYCAVRGVVYLLVLMNDFA